MFRLRFPVSRLAHWADRYDYRQSDDTPAAIGRVAKERGYVTSAELRSIAKWKSPRSAGRCDRNSWEFVREVTQASLQSREPRFKVEALRLLDGVDWPTASVILHFCDREPWPILDFRALWSLSVVLAPSQYSYDFWSEYTRFSRELAKRAKLDMRSLDRALWAYSKKNQPADAG